MAPSPVFVGYSLVGVYPCAVWKPQRVNSPTNNSSTTSIGPIRNTRTTTNRLVPYTTNNLQQQPQQQPQQQQQQNSVQIQIPLQQSTTTVPIAGICPVEHSTTVPPIQQTAPIIVKACNCNNTSSNGININRNTNNSTNNNVPTEVQGAQTTQMLFVPFSVPSFAPPMTASTLQNNNYSPSKVNNCNIFIICIYVLAFSI